MMSSVIPARLQFQCGHAALVSLPRIKGETPIQRAERVAREKSAAHTRACDFCAQRLEVVVLQAAPAPLPAPVPSPLPTASAPEPPKLVTPPPSPDLRNGTPTAEPVEPAPTIPAASLPLAAWHAERMAKAKPRVSARPKVIKAAAKAEPKVEPRVSPVPKTVSVAPKPVARPPRMASSAHNARMAKPTQFTVQFQVQATLTAVDVRDALRQMQALGAIEVLAITRAR
jgi:hypothetical protein